MAEAEISTNRFSFKKWPGGLMRFVRRRWWGITLLVGLILVFAYEYHWFRPQLPAPFDVDAFFAPEYFGEDRAPTAYRKVFAKIEKLDESDLIVLRRYSDLSSIKPHYKPKTDPSVLLSISEEIFQELIEAGKLKPGAWGEPFEPMPVSSVIAGEARWLLSSRSRHLLSRGQPEVAFQTILTFLQFGRHIAFRGKEYQCESEDMYGWHALLIFKSWAEHKSVSPKMILDALTQLRELKPARPTISEAIQGIYLGRVNDIKNPVSFVERSYVRNTKARRIFEKFVLRSTARSSLIVLNVVVAEHLTWCETPSWERRRWTFTESGPSHFELKVLGSKLSRTHLDTSIRRSKFLSAITSFEHLFDSYDLLATGYAVMETRAALIAFHKRTGSYPDRLDQLVPDYLPLLSLDPYSGRPLVLAMPLQDIFVSDWVGKGGAEGKKLIVTAGQKVLYSIGPKNLNMGDAGWGGRGGAKYVYLLPIFD